MTTAARLLVAVIRAYRRFVSPLMRSHCRFEPSCSGYALEAIRSRGAVVGSALALRRVVRCHPWSAGGLDPVPGPVSSRGGGGA